MSDVPAVARMGRTHTAPTLKKGLQITRDLTTPSTAPIRILHLNKLSRITVYQI